MNYFELLPKISYDNIYEIRNLFYKYIFEDEIASEYLYNYMIKDNETLESISFDVYDDPTFWWLLAIINNISDIIFDLPLDTEILKTIALEESTIEGELDLALFSENYDILEIENDAKRIIKILKPDYLSEVLVNIIRGV